MPVGLDKPSGKSGHVASVCRSKKKRTEGHTSKRSPPGRTQWVDTEITEPQASIEEPAEELIWRLGAKTSHPYQAILEVNEQFLTMEIDTGAAVSLIFQTTQEELFPSTCLDKSSLVFQTYTDEIIPVQEQMEAEVRYGAYTGHYELYAVRGKGAPLWDATGSSTSVWIGPVSSWCLLRVALRLWKR